jgi:hypothetical protein
MINAEALEKVIAKHASTDERKMIWVLIDGTRLPKDMVAIISNIKKRAIELFLEELERAQLITNPTRKPAEKLVDYVPPDWVDLLEKNKKRRKNGKKKKPDRKR